MSAWTGDTFGGCDMASCANCGTTILFGGTTQGAFRFCSKKCEDANPVVQVAVAIPDEVVDRMAVEAMQDDCPNCGRPGPIDVQNSHTAISFLIMTSWKTTPTLCCQSCGTRKRMGAIAITGLAGWWGFPWGLIMTPVQIVRNLTDMGGGSSGSPSKELREIMRVNLAIHMLETGQTVESMTDAGWPSISEQAEAGKGLGDLLADTRDIELEDLREPWRWLVGDAYTPILVTAIGDMFLSHEDGRIFHLHTGLGKLSLAASDEAAFRQLLLSQAAANEWLAAHLVQQLKAQGQELKPGECYSYEMPPTLGGKIEADNLQPADVLVHFRVMGEVNQEAQGSKPSAAADFDP